ncbi:trehalose-phosphatase [Microbacterium sp. SS28]|uniref:trehalose-phosphatase n=1 Tax=Microbacterium sp. SS28 TaxID=2919948 RepID=UPI001FAA6D80|nr:trehalose-phosphatase [Microbacterium sp. SS28]
MTAPAPLATPESLDGVASATPLLVALDFDGTLSPLVDEPMQARMLPAARTAVDALVAVPDTFVALVSGRSLDDLRIIAEHDDDSPLLLAGSHGAEYWIPGEGRIEPVDEPGALELRDRLRAEAERATADLEGVWIEPKTFGFGVHTRRMDAASAHIANRRVDRIVAENAPHWRRRTGHGIIEFAFRHEGKDAGVEALRARTGASAVLFAGDDVTDEDALRKLRPEDLGVHVGGGPTAARVSVRDIPAMADLLASLAIRRTAARQ